MWKQLAFCSNLGGQVVFVVGLQMFTLQFFQGPMQNWMLFTAVLLSMQLN